VVMSNVAQFLVGRIGVRTVLLIGLGLSTVSVAILARVPVDGHYFWDLFPAFVLGGAGLGMSFVPLTIASLTGVGPADAGGPSAPHNRRRRIGGPIAPGVTSRVPTPSPNPSRERPRAGPAPLDHALPPALHAITALLTAGIVAAIRPTRPQPPPAAPQAR